MYTHHIYEGNRGFFIQETSTLSELNYHTETVAGPFPTHAEAQAWLTDGNSGPSNVMELTDEVPF